MENTVHTGSKPDIHCAKIIPTPTHTAWSQAYNAGTVFAIVSLAPKNDSPNEVLLGPIGKEILNAFEEEYFTLETKNLATIKTAVETTAQKIPETVTASIIVASLIGTVLYLVLYNKGIVLLKRNEETGMLISSLDTENTFQTASGHLQNDDLIILATTQFTTSFAKDIKTTVSQNIKPQDIAEILSPKVHEHEEGNACAIIIAYKEPLPVKEQRLPPEKLPIIQQERTLTEQRKTNSPKQITKLLNLFSSLMKSVPLPKTFKLTHTKKMVLTIAIILVCVLASSIYFSNKKREEEKTRILFQSIISPAQKKYDEGQALLGLNKNLSREDFLQAQKLLTSSQAPFKKGSPEEKEVQQLLQKVKDALHNASGASSVQPQSADENKSLLLAARLRNPDYNFFARNDTSITAANNSNIINIDSTQKKKTVSTNKNDWKNIGGIGTYLTNIYLLDTTNNQILKYTPAGAEYGRSNYLGAGVSPDFSKAVALAIDGSIWVLGKDGSLQKFTRGKPDTLTVTGLDKQLLNPTRIATNPDFNNVYILDNGNSRIVVLNKDGVYQAQYTAPLLKTAQEFDVVEKNKKIYFLSDTKVWEIELP